MQKKLLQKGFTLVEIIITISLLLFGVVQMTSFFIPVVALSGSFYYRSVAFLLGQEGMEVVKNFRDNNIVNSLTWSTGLSICTAGCQLDYKTGTAVETIDNQLKPYASNPLNIDTGGFYSYSSGNATAFKRKVTITQPYTGNANILRVSVMILWDYNNKPFIYETIGYIYSL